MSDRMREACGPNIGARKHDVSPVIRAVAAKSKDFALYRLVGLIILICVSIASLTACSSIQGYPPDPENTDVTLAALAPYFNGTAEAQYVAATGDEAKTPLRNLIVYGRIRGYDIEFSHFEKSLYALGNSVALGGDLVGLILAGLTATTGNAATKAALGAASAGVIGANTATNKDLYYQKTIAALLSQMEASRLKARVAIAKGLASPDSKYNLFQAYSDLDTYKNAGSIPGAISDITQNAENQKVDAQQTLQGISLETPAVEKRYDVLTNYIAGLVAKQDTTTLTKVAGALGLSVQPGSTYLQIKGIIVSYLYEAIDGKPTEAEKLAALDEVAKKLKSFVTF